METNDLEVIKLRAMVISLTQLVNEKNYIVHCCWPCRNGETCKTFDLDNLDFFNRLQIHIKCNIKAYNPDQIISLFSKYAKQLYETNGYLSYEDGTPFQLFKFILNKYSNIYKVKINDLGYFAYGKFDYSNFIDVLADLMETILYKLYKLNKHYVNFYQEQIDKKKENDNSSSHKHDLAQENIINIDDMVKKYLVITEPIISINDHLLKYKYN